ncbi:hypothetical protein [Streptomyces sp. NPDC002853]
MTDTPTPPQTATDGRESASEAREGAGRPQGGSEAPTGAVQGSGGARLIGEPPAAYRQLIARLESDRAQMLAAVDATTGDKEELLHAQAGMASGYLHAAALAVRLFEGPEAVARYLLERTDGRHLTAHDGPTVAECAADDRRWGLEKEGE